ncbi:MAG: ATP-binding protein [Deltaproteobacteria bacterium]|nr:ATP-binding protein [Deltaproteobacteria bacterium]
MPCKNCQSKIEPYFRPAFLGLAPRWIPPSELCTKCEKQREKMEHVAREQQMLDDAFRYSRMSLRFRGRTFDNFFPEPHTKKAYQIALNFQFKNGGIIFLGTCGIGKTHLAAAIANRQIGKSPTLFISCPELLLELRNSISSRNRNQHHLFELARKVKLLVLDDIGAEKTSEWVQETLFVLINYRYEHILPTIFTSNCSLEELEKKLGKRIVSRIIEMCRCVKMEGFDWRIRQRKKAMEKDYE